MKTFKQHISEDIKADLGTNEDAAAVLSMFLSQDNIEVDVNQWMKSLDAKRLYDDIDETQFLLYGLLGSDLRKIESLKDFTRESRLYLVVSNRMERANAWHIESKRNDGHVDHIIGVFVDSMHKYFSHEFSHVVNSTRSKGRNQSQLHRDDPDNPEKSRIDYMSNHEELNAFFQEVLEFVKTSSVEDMSRHIGSGKPVEGIMDFVMINWDRGPELRRVLKLEGKEARRNSFYRRLFRLISSLVPSLNIKKYK